MRTARFCGSPQSKRSADAPRFRIPTQRKSSGRGGGGRDVTFEAERSYCMSSGIELSFPGRGEADPVVKPDQLGVQSDQRLLSAQPFATRSSRTNPMNEVISLTSAPAASIAVRVSSAASRTRSDELFVWIPVSITFPSVEESAPRWLRPEHTRSLSDRKSVV